MRKILLILCCLGFVACDSNKPALPEQIKEQEKIPVCDFSNMEKDTFLSGGYTSNLKTESKKENGHFEVNKTQLISCNCMFSHSDYECELPQEELLYKNTYKETGVENGKIIRSHIEKITQAVLENVSAICTVKCNDKLKKSSNMKEENVSQDNNKMIGRCYIYTVEDIYEDRSISGSGYKCGCYEDIKGEEKFQTGMPFKIAPDEECNAKCTEWCNKDEEERKKYK